MRAIPILCVVLAAGAALAAEPPTAGREIVKAAGVEAGLAVHLGATDGAMEADLASGGRMLVHGLALDDAALETSRAAIRARGLYGLASVEKAAALAPLPYAASLVNLLVADLDALGPKAPPQDEILRVLAPQGVACLKRGGAWARTVKPRPKEMDDWTHFDYGPEGNGVSHDRLVRPATVLQWIAGVQKIKLGGNPAGFRVYTGPRVAGGRLFFEWAAGDDKAKREQFYSGRDAFSGLALWNVRNTTPGRKDWQFVAAPGRLYTFLEKGGPLVALDADTGKVVRTFDQAARLTDEPSQTALRLCDGTILQTAGAALLALDAATGALRWKHEDQGALFFHCASAKAGRVFVAVADQTARGSSRWPVVKAQAIQCLDLASGKPVWRSTEIAGFYVGQLVYADGNLAVFASGAIGGGEEPFIGNLRAADGKLLWHATFKKQYNRFGYNMLVRDGRLYYADAWRLYAHDLQTGEEARPFDDGGYNMRCNRFAATDDWFIFGLVAYVDKNFRGVFQGITRSGCAIGATPANGMTYFTPNACGCITEVRGHVALSCEPLRPPVPDARRLETGGAAPAATPAASPPAAAPAGPVAEDWTRQDRAAARETEPVTADGKTFVAVIHEHRLECREAGGRVLWSYTAGGRVSSPPVLADGLCLFGSHDGWVYGLRAADGSPAWRFLAAPSERKMVAYGQLESCWPVYGVTMHGGLVCASAGLHPESGGGIYIYGLEPKTGRIAWKKVLAKSPIVCDGRTRIRITPNRILNEVLRGDGPSLSLPGIAFDPREPDAETQKKVDGEDAKAKK